MSDPYASFSSPAPSDPYGAFSSPAQPAPRPMPAAAGRTPPQNALGKRNWMGEVSGFAANVDRGLGIGDEIAAGLNTVRDVVTGRGVKVDPHPTDILGDAKRAIGATFARNMGQQRGIEDSYTADRPYMAALAKGSGNALTVVAPGAKFVPSPNMAVNALQGATAAGATAATYAALDRGTPAERLANASSAAKNPVVLVLGAAGGALATPRGVKDVPQVKAKPASNAEILTDAGVSLTPGQRIGGMAKGAEDLAQRSPILGPAVQGARERGLQSLNRAVANRALAPIGEGVPKNIPAGNKAVEHVATRLGNAYDEAAAMVPVVAPDTQFATGLANIKKSVSELGPNVAGQFDKIIENRLDPVLNKGTISGADIRDVQSQVGRLAADFGSADDRLQQKLGAYLDDLNAELGDLLGRTNPAVADKINQANEGWAIYARLRNAASKASKGGIFTPGQLSTSVRVLDRSVGKGDVAKGNALLQDLSSAASTIMPDQFGNPGTANFLSHSSLAGSMIAAPQVGVPVAAGFTAAATPYFLMGRRVVESLPSNATTAQLRTAAADLARLAANDPAVAALQSQVAARLARGAGVAGAAASASVRRNALSVSTQ